MRNQHIDQRVMTGKPPRSNTRDPLRLAGALWRGLSLLALVMLGFVLTILIATGDRAGHRPRWTAQIVRWWHAQCCRALGIQIAVTGKPIPAALLVANHISWLDILVLGAQGEIGFLSKAEVRAWPMIGWMAAVAGTLFITRGASQTADLMTAIGKRIQRGQQILIFPEGTTSDGTGLLRFHPRLFGIGQQAGIPIQPIALRYGKANAPDPTVPYIGDDTFIAHLVRMLRHPGLIVQVQFLAPIDPTQADRRQLAEQARDAIGTALGLTEGAPSHRSNDLSRLTIAVVTETYPPEINGVANTMRHLVTGLTDHGHRVHLVRPRQGRRESPQGRAGSDHETLVPSLPLPGYRGLRFGLPVGAKLRQLWRRLSPDIVYIATEGPLGHAALSAAHGLDIPAVTGFHTQFDQYSRHYGLGLLKRQIGRMLRGFHNRSDATLVPTAELMTRLAEQGYHRLHLFGRGVDTRLFNPERRSPALRAQWGCTGDDLVVLYVGRLAAEKNLALALATFAAIAARDSTARFVLVGDGPGLERLRHDYPQYRFVGPKVGIELAEHYASGDLFLFPSLTETFGNVVPEAMASGLPVVAFDYAAAHAYLVTGHNGITVATEDPNAFIAAAQGLAADHEHLHALGRAARATAAELDWDQVIWGVEQQLHKVIRRRGSEDRHETVVAATQ